MKKSLCALLIALILATCVGCGDNPSNTATTDDSDTVYTLSYGCSGDENSASYLGVVAWKEYIEAESNGRIKVELYPNSQLGNDREMAEAVQMGQLVMMSTASSNFTPFIPELEIFDIPFVLQTKEDVSNLFADEEFCDTLSGYFESKGMKLLGQNLIGFRHLTSNREIHTLADMEGMSIRVMEATIPQEMWKDLGCEPTPISFSELYTALQQGLVDAQENPIQMIYGQKFYEQQKYFIYTGHQIMEIFHVMNPDWFASLPSDLQTLIEESMPVFYEVVEEKNDELDQSEVQEMADSGVTFIELDSSVIDEMRTATESIWDIVEQDYPDAAAAYRDALSRSGIL